MAKELVRQKQVELEAAIVASGEVRLLASEMNSAGLMSNKDHGEITAVGTWWTDGQRAGSVVTILRNKVNVNPSNLEKFIRILRSKSEFEDIVGVFETTAAGSEPTKYRATTQGSQLSSSDHSPALPGTAAILPGYQSHIPPPQEGLTRGQGPQRSWQDRIPDTHLDNGSNEAKETRIPDTHFREAISGNESHAPSPSANLKERYKFKGKRIIFYGSVVVMIILATGFVLNTNTYTIAVWFVRREQSTDHNTQPINKEQPAGPSTTPTDPKKIKQTKDKEYTPVLIKYYKDVRNVLKRVDPDYVPYKKMCRDLLKEETCYKLIGKKELDVDNIAMYYFWRHSSLYWHDLISILCNQFGENHLAGEVAKEHGVPFEKYCPTNFYSYISHSHHYNYYTDSEDATWV